MSGDHNQFQKPKSYLDNMNEVRKALEMALIALENANDMFSDDCSVEDVYADEIKALTKVLEKKSFECPRCGHCCQALETEPFEYWNAVEGWVKIDEVREHFDAVGCGTIYKSAGEGRSPLYTAPPKQWVGLPESAFAAMTLAQASAMKYAELLLKEKNT